MIFCNFANTADEIYQSLNPRINKIKTNSHEAVKKYYQE